ncbi:MAG TPA: glutamate synthase subunit beta, partial [Nitrospiria bacterium]|nr:glutamate synthase subunit beta [Nitrospiria bacterium]
YGIPDFKMEKWVLDRRLEQMKSEGVVFKTGIEVGTDLTVKDLRGGFDAVCLAGGAQTPRDLQVPGRELGGVHLAMEYLTQQNKINAGDSIDPARRISAEGKNVIVIGGGDTGSDCVGTAKRQGAKEISQFELLPKPPDTRSDSSPWPLWPMMLRTSHAHEEGCEREWSISTKKLSGRNGRVEQLHAARVSMETDKTGRPRFEEVSGSETEVKADLILLAMGFTGPLKDGLLAELGVDLDPRGNVSVDDYYMTSEEGIFAAGDMKRGASLIVWAIREGRDAAAGINRFLSVRKPRS